MTTYDPPDSGDAQRDQNRDVQRDQNRDAQRDQNRDAQRDQNRDVQRDQNRDVQRDQNRDVRRDQNRDVRRDEDRDASREAYQDAESSYERSVGRTSPPIRPRGETRDQARNSPTGHSNTRDLVPARADVQDDGGAATRGASADPRRASASEKKPSGALDSVPLVIAMAEECRAVIAAREGAVVDLPASLQMKHLSWMCSEVVKQADAWPQTKLHRWIGFIVAGMIAGKLVRLDGARRMFEDARKAHPDVDHDLLDHLDPNDGFELDLGGQG